MCFLINANNKKLLKTFFFYSRGHDRLCLHDVNGFVFKFGVLGVMYLLNSKVHGENYFSFQCSVLILPLRRSQFPLLLLLNSVLAY